jgi:serpin B
VTRGFEECLVFPAVDFRKSVVGSHETTTTAMKSLTHAFLGMAALSATATADTAAVALSINAFGLDLHRVLAKDGGNCLASPWSIESALAMTFVGAAGQTKDEMAKVLHFPVDEAALHAGFAAIAADLTALARASRERVEETGQFGGPETPLQIVTANRLFGQSGQSFEKPFLKLLENTYAAPLEQVDFIRHTEGARIRINSWVEEQTRERIKDLVPSGILNEKTRLVLANAIYLNAAWTIPFHEVPDLVFHADGTNEVMVPGLYGREDYGHRKIPEGALVPVPYEGGGLQFLIALPDERGGLAAFEKRIDAAMLAEAVRLPKREVILRMPKFKLEPGRVMLTEHLKAMGMPRVFDQPLGSADFSRMASRRPDDYLYISDVVHKSFIEVNKNGTEAAATTSMGAGWGDSIPTEPPPDIRVDRPFLFAIQHVSSGACLFLGRVADPR